MRYFYYLKTSTKEVVYQDEDVAKEAAKGVEAVSKAELQTQLETHKIEIYDPKTETKTVVDAKDSTCLIRWDGRSPYYELVKGTAPTVVPFLGWPQVSKENYVAPVDEPVKIVEEVKEEKIVVQTPEDVM